MCETWDFSGVETDLIAQFQLLVACAVRLDLSSGQDVGLTSVLARGGWSRNVLTTEADAEALAELSGSSFFVVQTIRSSPLSMEVAEIQQNKARFFRL